MVQYIHAIQPNDWDERHLWVGSFLFCVCHSSMRHPRQLVLSWVCKVYSRFLNKWAPFKIHCYSIINLLPRNWVSHLCFFLPHSSFLPTTFHFHCSCQVVALCQPSITIVNPSLPDETIHVRQDSVLLIHPKFTFCTSQQWFFSHQAILTRIGVIWKM
jgi:hypothetical protein